MSKRARIQLDGLDDDDDNNNHEVLRPAKKRRANAQPLELNAFMMDLIKLTFIIAFIGKRGTGKSTAMFNVAYAFKWIPIWLCFSGTDAANGDWSRRLPESAVYPEWRSDVVKVFVKNRLRLAKENRHNPNFKLTPAAIVIDDMAFDSLKIMHDPWFLFLVMNGRHLGILMMISVQYIMQLTRDVRSNVDLMVSLKEPNPGNRKRIYQEWSVIEDFQQFDATFKKYTENNTAFVVLTRSQTYNPTDCVFYWKTTYIPPTMKWTLGAPEFWKHHERLMNERKGVDNKRSRSSFELTQSTLDPKRLKKNHEINAKEVEDLMKENEEFNLIAPPPQSSNVYVPK